METTTQKLSYLLYWTIIFIVSGSMFIYGIMKPIQFQDFANSTSNNLSEGHKLMWSFYSYTKAYPIIIGILEVFGAITILFYRTRLFGCLLLSTILVNIIIQDYLYEILALNAAIFYLILILYIIVFDIEKVKNIISVLFKPGKNRNSLFLIVIALIIAIIIKFFETRIL